MAMISLASRGRQHHAKPIGGQQAFDLEASGHEFYIAERCG